MLNTSAPCERPVPALAQLGRAYRHSQSSSNRLILWPGEAGEDIRQRGFQINAVELGRLDQRAGNGSGFASGLLQRCCLLVAVLR